VSGLDVQDQVNAASAETRSVLARTGIGDGTPGQAYNPWAEACIRQMMGGGATACPHVRRRVVQPIFAYAWERVWRCQRCDEAHARTTAEQMRAGTYRDLGLIEENTCDRCRRYVGGQLTMLVVRTGFMVLVCTRCADDAQQGGAKEIAS
jgi:hypothetical protein